MTDKEQVLEIYPNCVVKVLTNRRTPTSKQVSIYLINVMKKLRPKSPYKNMTEKKYTLGVGSTEDKAWAVAWSSIQKEMLEKLEYDC